VRRVFILLLAITSGCTELGQQVRTRHAQIYQCRPGWVEVKGLGYEAGTHRYLAHGCGHTVLYVCAGGRPCEAQSSDVVEPARAATPAN
jgi:hypothetical protein